MRTTSTNTTDCRCKNCQALLAKHDRDGLSIRRGDMQTTVTGADFTEADLNATVLRGAVGLAEAKGLDKAENADKIVR